MKEDEEKSTQKGDVEVKEDGEKYRRKERNSALFRCIAVCVVTFLQTAGYGSLVVLQSSINIEGGIGAWSVMSTYIAGAVFNLFVVPTLIRKFGARNTMLFALLMHLIYSLAQFYPGVHIDPSWCYCWYW